MSGNTGVAGLMKLSKEEALQMSHEFLKIANQHSIMNPLLHEFVEKIKGYADCEAVGIRLLDHEGNIPYEAYEGFPREFYESESPLSIKSDRCMCIYVIKGETDPTLPFFTGYGSFLMNGTTRFLATVSEEEKGQTRNVCNEFGYESVGLIPIRVGARILGLIQLADSREDRVPLELVELLEKVAMQLGTALQRIWAEDELRRYQEHLEDIVQERTADLKNTQEELRRYSESLEQSIRKSEFYKDLLAHDMTNILQSISFSTEVCFASVDDAEQLEQDLKGIDGQVERAVRLIENVKTLSKFDEGIPPLVSLEVGGILRDAIESIRQNVGSQKVEIRADLPGQECHIQANLFLFDLFQNILTNAIKFNQNPIPKIFIRFSKVRRDGMKYLQLEFMDDGIGIPDGQKEGIFQRSERRAPSKSGRGVGLSLVKKIIDSYKGRVWVEDRVPGDYSKGSIFFVQIPEV
jgi:signal transduction histidine kinase